MYSELKTVELFVSGKVQGVGFRACIKRTADSLGICGTAMNLDDGRVHIVASGEDMIVEKFISMLYSCPRASIRNIESGEHELLSFEGFHIKRGFYQYGT